MSEESKLSRLKGGKGPSVTYSPGCVWVGGCQGRAGEGGAFPLYGVSTTGVGGLVVGSGASGTPGHHSVFVLLLVLSLRVPKFDISHLDVSEEQKELHRMWSG